MDVSNEAVMADGQRETHRCYDAAQSRGEKITLIVAGQICSRSSNILIGCGKLDLHTSKNNIQ